MQNFPDLVINSESAETIQSAAYDLVAKVKPTWPRDDYRCKKFTEGISNHLVGVYRDGMKDDMVLVRIYGNNTDQIIDREAEKRNMRMFFENKCGPEIYAMFKNGLAYSYVPGDIFTVETIVDPKLNQMIIEMMVKMHKMNTGVPKAEREPCCWRRLKQFQAISPDGFPDDPVKAKRYQECGIISKAQLAQEIADLESALGGTDSPVVFAHNDLLLANMIHNKEKKTVTFIDYEYGEYNYQAFDLGNHFCEFPGVEGDLDYERYYPTETFQKDWLRRYLQAYQGWDASDADVHKLYVQTNQFALAAQLTWGIWALVQAKFSDIDFDFIYYAKQRLGEYLKKKEQFLALK